MTVPFVDLHAATAEIREELELRWSNILDNSNFIGGAIVEAFETEFAAYCGAKYAVATGSGTDAIRIALQALGVGPGDSVVSVPNTFVASVSPVVSLGALPLFVDIDPNTQNIDPEALADFLQTDCKLDANGDLFHTKTGTKVVAIIPVHLYGRLAPVNEIVDIASKFDLRIVEDSCQAHGAVFAGTSDRAGTLGDFGCFSFYAGKNLGAFGDAGALITNDPELAQQTRMMRDHFSSERYVHEGALSWNSRLDVLQAEVLRLKLPLLDKWNDRRIEIANSYRELLSELPINLPTPTEGRGHVYHLYVVEIENRDAVMTRLSEAEIGSGLHYPTPIHLQPGFRYLGHEPGSYPNTEKSSGRLLSLPIWPHMKDDQIKIVCDQLSEILK